MEHPLKVLITEPKDSARQELARQVRSLGLLVRVLEEPCPRLFKERLMGRPPDEATDPAATAGSVADLILIGLDGTPAEGLSLIYWLKQSARHRSIPVIAYGNTLLPATASTAYGHHVNCVISFSNLVSPRSKDFHPLRFWLGLVELPR